MENRNGRGIFLGVVSVATLIVAIIGATFAYFSASVTAGNNAINGSTLDVSESALSLTVSPKLNVGGTLQGDKGEKLVPAVMTETAAGYGAAVSAHCEDTTNGYTGCHVYEIAVTSSNPIKDATLSASLSLTGTDDDNWSYALLQQASASIHTAASSGTAPTLTQLKEGNDGATPTAEETSVHRFNDGRAQELVTEDITSGTTYYYLVVYLLNTSSSQNGVTGDGSSVTNETGTYTGTITLSANGGQVKASFATGV